MKRIILIFLLFCGFSAVAQRQMEHLSRGLVAVQAGNDSVFVSWRLLHSDAEDVAFNVYRQSEIGEEVLLNDQPLTDATSLMDVASLPNGSYTYRIKPVINGSEGDADGLFQLVKSDEINPWLTIPLQTPERYSPGDIAPGDLDGDGDYELVVHMTGRGRDNSHEGMTSEPVFHAYKQDGTLLWSINLGKNIREGAHYTQFLVYDFDGDGRAEVVMKTADGTVDGTGKVIGDASADHRNQDGHILRGPEFLTVFDGLTGAALATVPYVPGRHPSKLDPAPDEMKEIWGDGNANRSERYLACVAYLDGKRPSIVMCRGYYTRATLAAYDWRDGKLTQRWLFDSDDGTPGNRAYRGQGNHSVSVGDVDGDGCDEIIYGAAAIDHDGTGLHSTGLGHADALHLSDLNPARPGLEVFNIQERFGDAGMNFRDAHTGEILWKVPSVKAADSGGDKGEGPGRGVAFNVDPRYPGNECWVFGAGINGLWNAQGEKISETTPRSCNFAVWWDGDLLRELLDRNRVMKWDWKDETLTNLLVAEGCQSNNGSKSTPALSADLFGDWREEVVLRTEDNQALRIYTTTIPTHYRLVTLMHDPIYRLSIAWQNVAYNQPPHPGFYMGDEMEKPIRHELDLVKYQPAGSKQTSWKFDLGNGPVKEGFTQVTEKNSYTPEKGFGIISANPVQAEKMEGRDDATGDWITSDKPFYFQVDLPEGRYKITLTLGNGQGESATTVKAESRRLMLENIQTEKGEVLTKTIVVDVRTPRFNDSLEVRRKPREMTYLNWDNSLTLEFNGPRPCVSSIVIEKANDLPVIFLAGNSTVTDQENEPWASWGQMFPRFLKPEIVVANYAESGETLKAFRRENRLQKILSLMKPGDYLFMEFAHNDQKPGGNHVEPFTTYQDELRHFISEARKKGGKPVLVTSTNRRRFDEGGKIINTLEDYPEAMRQLGKVEGVPVIDLNAMSKVLYEALGPENSKKAFVHYPANTYPGQDKPLADDTHFSPFGAYELAKCVVKGILDQQLDLANYVADEFSSFNPSEPDSFENFFWPESPAADILKPDGN